MPQGCDYPLNALADIAAPLPVNCLQPQTQSIVRLKYTQHQPVPHTVKRSGVRTVVIDDYT